MRVRSEKRTRYFPMKKQITYYDCSDVSTYSRKRLIDFCLLNCYHWNIEKLENLKKSTISVYPDEEDIKNALDNAFHFGICVDGTTDVLGNPIKFKKVNPLEVYFITEELAFSVVLDKGFLTKIKKEFKIRKTENE